MSEHFFKDEDIWCVQVREEGVVNSIRKKIYDMMAEYHIRDSDIKGIALGPNEFNSLRLEIMKQYLVPDTRIASATELQFMGFNIYCAPRTGVQILLDGRWDIQIKEARKYLSLEGLDA